jgi:hypothetical protein
MTWLQKHHIYLGKSAEQIIKADRSRVAHDSQTKTTITNPDNTRQIPRHATAA